MAGKLRYRLKIDAPIPGWIKTFAPNVLVFICYDVPKSVLDNIPVANGVLAPFGVSITITLSV